MMLIRMAWRNLWRNPRRTFITLFSMVFGLTMMIVGYALMDGMTVQMVHYATLLGSGHVQIHHPDYIEDHSMYDTLEDPDELLARVGATDLGNASPRMFATALASSGPQSAGAQLWGIDPEAESTVTELYKHLEKGEWLSDRPSRSVILGRNLARTLSASPGDEIVVLTQAADGSLGNEIYTVSGVLKSIGEMLDRGGILMHIEDLAQLLVLDGRIHEIALKLQDPDDLEGAREILGGVFDRNRYDIRDWKQLFPELAEYLKLSSGSMTIILFVIFAVASLGIINTQLMSLFERTREVGIMRALGLGPFAVARLVFFETIYMLLMAALIGGVTGSIWSLRLERHGWDISWMGGSFDFVGVAFEPYLYASLRPAAIIDSIWVMVVVVLVASLYPLYRAARISPVDAIGRGR
jgi:ABC-type lipoprotein release transport system permease subunit